MSAIYCLLYAVMMLALSLPLSAMAPLPPKGVRAPGAVAFLCALASTYALPWGGVPSVSSAAWFPLSLAALLLLPVQDGQKKLSSNWSCKAFAIALTGVFLWAMRSFMLRIGTPGDLYSLEGMSAVFRLSSLGSWLLVAQAALFAGLAVSFALTGLRGSPAASLFFFSCAGFLTTVFLSPLLARATIAMGVEPPRSVAVQIVAALFVAAFLGRLLGHLSARAVGMRRPLAGIAVFGVLLGCVVLVWYR